MVPFARLKGMGVRRPVRTDGRPRGTRGKRRRWHHLQTLGERSEGEEGPSFLPSVPRRYGKATFNSSGCRTCW